MLTINVFRMWLAFTKTGRTLLGDTELESGVRL